MRLREREREMYKSKIIKFSRVPFFNSWRASATNIPTRSPRENELGGGEK